MKFNTAYQTQIKVDTKYRSDLPSQVEQNHLPATDINHIVSKYQKTGHIEHRSNYRGEYGFATAQTLQDALDITIKAKTMFEELPAQTRQHFNHDPAQFLEFVQNPENASTLVDMGLAQSTRDIPSEIEQLVQYTIQKVGSATDENQTSSAGDA